MKKKIFVIVLFFLLIDYEESFAQELPSILSINLLQFHNPTGRTYLGQCCDGSFPSNNACPITISCTLSTIVCLDFVNSELSTGNWTLCPLGSKSLKININTTSLLNYYSINEAIPISTMQFDLPLINDNSIRIKVFVFYETINGLLNHFHTIHQLSSSHGILQQLTLIDRSKNGSYINQVILAVKSSCRSTFYGKQCSRQCIANDDCTSSYTCDAMTGEKICSSGWTGTDCSIRNSSFTCSSMDLICSNGGFCLNNHSSCCCPTGYTGSNCQYLSRCIPGQTCLNGGTCKPTYDVTSRTYYFECHCPSNYTGLICDEKLVCPPTFYGSDCSIQCIAPNSCFDGHFSCNSQGQLTCREGWGPSDTCQEKLLAPLFDHECPVSTGCLNGGSCFNGSCCCPPSFTGRLCEISIDPCVNNSCQNNALCLSTSTGYKCQCSSSMLTGSHCEINENPCQYSPCQNGICQSLGNTSSFSCMCYPGYTGQFCHMKINYCLSQPCENQGICASMATGFVCTCLSSYTGPTCSISIDSCPQPPCGKNQTLVCLEGWSNPPMCIEDIDECRLNQELCKNGGQCINTLGSYYCKCNQYYQGSDCSIPLDPCLSNPCVASNSISCSSVMNTLDAIDFNCTCRVGFTGPQCEIELNPCMNNPCFYGQCVALTPLSWSCTCEPGWTGIDCQESIDECLSNPCLNAGICVDGMSQYHCDCLNGFTGANCEVTLDPCADVPCQNNGTCFNQIETHSCLCPRGWTGKFCEVNINECSSPLSCHPNATCVDLPGSYQCLCPPWLTGPTCLTALDQCETFICLNDGVCVNNYGTLPTCHCQAGFTGVFCEVNIDDCQATPCANNGTCIDQVNSFLCLCPSGYTGLRCQTPLSQCNSLPCLNGGTCRDAYGSEKKDDFLCLCPPFFTGRHCENILNPCTSFPCRHGSCIPMTPSYKCQCDIGYTGPNCETMVDQCASGPCGSHGNCTNLATKHSCCCASGYTGAACEQLIDVCLTNPCSIEGVDRCISNGTSSFGCVCKAGYSGRYCEININECLSQPCLNGGICIDFLNSYQCLCPLIYTGANCQYLQDQCVGIQCLNGGRCQNNRTNLTCLCAPGFHGDNCELIHDYCQSQPCANGGICSNTESGPLCSCPGGVTGKFCETIIDQCKRNSCENNGTCQSLIDQYVCLCPSGFLGHRCETERNECEPINPCLNSGRCVDNVNGFSCICNPGFTGVYCETQIDRCQSNPCLNGGICHTFIDSYKCDCPQGYTGSTCSTIINHCASNPCLHDGLCISLLDAYRCVCLDDYIGLHCEKTSNECFSNPCLNNGTCVDHIWNYTCQCPAGFTGSHCQTEINFCQSSPCIEGLCKNKVNGYDCICPSSSYKGIHCEIQVNQCSSQPCLHGGTCINGVKDFVCLCPPWYSGETCSERIDPCLNQSPCANNGTCMTNLNVKPYGHICQCQIGFTGPMCEINVDDCVSQPCLHGRCLDKVNGFICQCYQGYEGLRCDNIINHCSSNPCHHNGQCQSLINAYQCICASGYQGSHCEYKIDRPCQNNACLNNGTCAITSNNQVQCTCLYGYTGSRCEVKINACQSNPCQHGTCQEFANGFYYCSCSAGFTGFHCDIDINECESSPCLHHGICQEGAPTMFNCICPSGYSGQQCQLIDYQCRAAPCLNNGTCTALTDGYQCKCSPGLRGTRCEIDIDECASHPCQNKGICLQSSLNQYQCYCPSGYTGIHCESIVDPCLSKTCLNNGTCIRTNSLTGLCSCLPGFTGLSCQNQINACLSAPCLNGTCVPMINSYQCNCFPGYSGSRCNTMINHCSSNPCFNNGTCINQATSYACQCPYGFQGRTCVIRVQACQSSPCLNGGTCSDVAPGLHRCSCPLLYRGDFCQLRDSFCLTKPCQNNGVCLDTLNGYQCVCQPGYQGINCTSLIQPCLSHPCFNDGTCRNANHGLSYQCLCRRGYAGLRCELEVNWCSSNPCQNQGTCISHLTSFVCLCPSSYTGLICQTPINNCSLTTCESGVPLMTSPTSCSCICSDGYTGSRCDIPINPCLNSSYCVRGTCNYLSPGLANCTCPPGYSGLRCATQLGDGLCSSCPCLYGQCRPMNEINSYVCDCYQGYSGKNCDISINLCQPTPCLYGQCFLDDMQGYRCQCLLGATGRNCSTLIDTCSSTPCLNNGVCIPELNSYQCVCQPGYAGSHCEILINQCTSLVCLNNGTCINLPTTPPSAKCQCPSLYTGLQCQYPYAPCASQPCQNLGTCVAHGLSSYSCQCPNGFSGKDCETHIDVCSSKPCLNGGHCSEPAPFYYICQCPWPFYGINCELMSDPCLSYPCRGPHSQCISSTIHQNFTCLCTQAFGGPTCSTPVDPCQSVQCKNGGSCVRIGLLTHSCSCPAGYRGVYCEIEIDPCTNFTCTHGISIKTSPTECQCQCSHSYYGKSCDVNLCEENPCVTGKCISNGTNTYQCQCPSGFQSMMGVCVDINECRMMPGLCSNGGRCLNTYGSYSCFCKTGFYGEHCEIFDPCRSVSCLNGGMCRANGTYPYWQCQCPDSFTGSHCEQHSLRCASNPCRTGTCQELDHGQYQCKCPPSVTGVHCDTPLLPCDSNPCSNNSTCLSLSLNNFTCVCPPWYTGVRCAEKHVLCSKNPCQNNATCLVNAKTGEEMCQCPPERYGIYCEFQSPCASNPCQHGTCQNRDETTFECVCDPSFTGTTCETSIDVCSANRCFNGGTCFNVGYGLFECICPPGFTDTDCRTPVCLEDSCYNGGRCLIEKNRLHCECPCGFTGTRCETPFDSCSLTSCLNNGTRVINSTQCHCACLCPPTFTGHFCQIPVLPVNRTYSGQIVIPMDRSGGSSWENVLSCIDQVWNSANSLLFCPSPFTLVQPTRFNPYCYRTHSNDAVMDQTQAMHQCNQQHSELVWFQTSDELHEHLMPALVTNGLTRDFWTSGVYNSSTHQWQWYLSANHSRTDTDSSMVSPTESVSEDQSLYVTFNPSVNRRLAFSSSSNKYSVVCKRSATHLFLNDQTRRIALTSQLTALSNQTQVMIYHFNYTLLPNVPLHTSIQQPTNNQYAAMCGAMGNPIVSVKPYTMDICGYFSSILDGDVQLLMRTVGSYYTARRISLTSQQSYSGVPLRVDHFVTISGTVLTRIFFVIKSGTSTVLGSNIEPLASINEILKAVPHRDYEQCKPYLSLNILLPLKLCIPLNEISSKTQLIADAIAAGIGQSHVNVMLKGVQEGTTTTGRPAHIAYLLVTINGLTYDQSPATNVSSKSVLLSAIQRLRDPFLCSSDTEILLLERSIRDFHAPCAAPPLLEQQLNNALQQAGIYSMTVAIFGMEEAVDELGHVYRLPNIFLRDSSGSWLNSPLEMNSQLAAIFMTNQMQRITDRLHRLTKSYSYLYTNPLSTSDRDFLLKHISTLHNQQNSIPSNQAKIIHDDLYLNISSMKTIHRVYISMFHDDEELDGRYSSKLIFSEDKSMSINDRQRPLISQSNEISIDLIKQRDAQQISFTGKFTKRSAERVLIDIWQNAVQPQFVPLQVSIIELQEYLIPSMNQFYTTITYAVMTSKNETVSNACLPLNFTQIDEPWCDASHQYLVQAPFGSAPSFIDLQGDFSQISLEKMNIVALINAALERLGISATVTSMFGESRFGFDVPLITRVYYTTIPNQIIDQQQIEDHLKSFLPNNIGEPSTSDRNANGQISIPRSDVHQLVVNFSFPLTERIRINLEQGLTSFNARYGQAKIIHYEATGRNQTRLYLVFINGSEIFTRCDFVLYYPGLSSLIRDESPAKSIYLERNVFLIQSATLAEKLRAMWTENNIARPESISIQLKNPMQYICSEEKRFVRVKYFVNGLPPSNATLPSIPALEKIYGKSMADCAASEAYSIYLIEPRIDNKVIYQALEQAWRQFNHIPINISSEFFIDSSYFTHKNQTLTRLIYTIRPNSSGLTPPWTNAIRLTNIYASVPYKQYRLYLENRKINSSVLSMINHAIRRSWSAANHGFFTANDLFVPSIHPTLSSHAQMSVDYLIGVHGGDIGDYAQPPEHLYSQMFNQTGLGLFVSMQSKPRSGQENLLNNDRSSVLPFDYRSGGPFYGLDWWIILIIILSIFAVWFILCFICYICFRKRSSNRYQHKISNRTARRIDVLAREQDPYLRPSLSSLAFDGPYAESMHSSMHDEHHQRTSTRTMSSVPELQVRRLSEHDWPHFAMQQAHDLPTFLTHSSSQSTTSTRPL